MPLPDPNPIIRKFAAKWEARLSDVTGPNRERHVVYARAEAARALAALGFNVKWLQHLLQRDRTTILYYLGATARRINIPVHKEGNEMPVRKLTAAQRTELVRLYKAGEITAAAKLARSWNVSPYYGCVLLRRISGTAKARKWARAYEAGPINPEGAQS